MVTDQACSFCLRNARQVRRLIAGPGGVRICNECVALCHEMLTGERDADLAPSDPVELFLSPQRIYKQLEDYVVGHEQAKRVLSVAVYNHLKRINNPDSELEKSNILLIGPTGSGKTLLARSLAQLLDVPFCIADATALTEAGYVGDDVETVLARLIEAAGGDLDWAAMGIVHIDEIDKIARKSGANPSITRDVSGEGVQAALLKIIEGSVVNVPVSRGESVQLDTRNVLFICGGSFAGLEEIIAQRREERRDLGFAAARDEDAKSTVAGEEIAPADLVAFGLIPELVGRLPVVATLRALDRETLIRILTEPKNALLCQYQQLLELDGVELQFTKEALAAAAEEALRRGTGARGLRAIIEAALLDLMYVVPSREDIHRVVVDRDAVRGRSGRGSLGRTGGSWNGGRLENLAYLAPWHIETPPATKFIFARLTPDIERNRCVTGIVPASVPARPTPGHRPHAGHPAAPSHQPGVDRMVFPHAGCGQ